MITHRQCYSKYMILGIDEVGRGPWAGPLVVGAVVLGECTIEGLADSKKLSRKKREQLAPLIQQQAAAWALGWVSAQELDDIGMSAALKLAARRAVEHIQVPYHEIIIDGTINLLADTSKGDYVTTLKKADQLIAGVSAASIVAKVARDNYMIEQDAVYPGYGFQNHVGYGTAEHRAAIAKLGVTPLHRLSFAPLAKYRDSLAKHTSKRRILSGAASWLSAELATLKQSSTCQEPSPDKIGPVANASLSDETQNSKAITSKQIGDAAETAVVKYLQKRGHKIIERNWKTRVCEIDIVSQLGDTIYFTEVKYRRQPAQGGGLAAITPRKLQQMEYAAKVYAQANHLSDVNLRLAVASVTGSDQSIEAWLEVN